VKFAREGRIALLNFYLKKFHVVIILPYVINLIVLLKVTQNFAIFDIFGCFFTWQQRLESPVKDSNLSLSRKISQKIRIFESGFADLTQHYNQV
jgi:hypothetical protein